MASNGGTRKDRLTCYRPGQRHELGWFQTWAVMIGNIAGARDLIWQLFKRDFVAAYKKSFIGYTWRFITPIIGIVSWVFLKETDMLKPGDLEIPYTAYIITGTTMWALFMSFYGGARNTLQAGGGMQMKVKYPHEALLFKQVASRIANFTLRFAVVLVVVALCDVTLRWEILLLPAVALPLFFLGSAIGLVLSMVAVVAVDVSRIVNRGMSLLMFATPIIYTDQVESAFVRELVKYNPLTYLVCSARDLVLYGRLYQPKLYFIVAAASLVAFLLSWRLFYVSEDKIVERMI